MKLHADKPEIHTITAHGDGWVAINGERHERSLILNSSGVLLPWDCPRFEDLTEAHFQALLSACAEPPELALFGCGARWQFPRPALLMPLISQRIGVETMDTPAACRTFNILAGEGRRVVVGLLIGPDR